MINENYVKIDAESNCFRLLGKVRFCAVIWIFARIWMRESICVKLWNIIILGAKCQSGSGLGQKS